MNPLRDRYPAGVPCWIDLTPPDVDAAVAFYGGLFGWDFEQRTPPDAPQRYLIASLGGATVCGIGSPVEGTRSAATTRWSTYVAVDDAEAAAKAVADAGGRVLMGPVATGPAGRWVECLDPEGGLFHLWQGEARPGAQLVNDTGSWNSSDLHTADLDGARAFYGAVFGWEPRRLFEGADAAMLMWCLPGYGDFLESINPGTLQSHADAGAPAGFSDAVGWLSRDTPGSGPYEVPSWHVTFSVDGTDAAVERAQKLGARVLAEPVDMDPVRFAVLEDPQGAPFSVSTYTPPPAS